MEQGQPLDERGMARRDVNQTEAGGFKFSDGFVARKWRGVWPTKRVLDRNLPHRDGGNENLRV